MPAFARPETAHPSEDAYPGEHVAIIERLLWDRVHEVIGETRILARIHLIDKAV